MMSYKRSKMESGVGLMLAEPPEMVGHGRSHRQLVCADVHGRARLLNRRKVARARRRLAAGFYDSSELLESLLETILADVTS